jgi:hypothetical protein
MLGLEATGNAQAIIAGDPIATFMGGLTRTVALAGIPAIGASATIHSAGGTMLVEAGEAIATARLAQAHASLALVSGFVSAGASVAGQAISNHGKVDWADVWMAGDVGSITGGLAPVLARVPVGGDLVDKMAARLGASFVGSFGNVTQYAYTERAHGRELQSSKLIFNAVTGAIAGWGGGPVTFPKLGNHNYYYYFWNENFQATNIARTWALFTGTNLPLDEWSKLLFNSNQDTTKP